MAALGVTPGHSAAGSPPGPGDAGGPGCYWGRGGGGQAAAALQQNILGNVDFPLLEEGAGGEGFPVGPPLVDAIRCPSGRWGTAAARQNEALVCPCPCGQALWVGAGGSVFPGSLPSGITELP